ncbi:cysteine-rich DPF motif domain-containing protein 1-like [Liolophura sinensis]|uniref:cysteine-rich DPF motif domain-containing protein 1-like n=1 Tax=Liolophura sinensis TaxID=3198878 RepID=UPI0031592047
MGEETKEFTCSNCMFSVKYNYFGTKPPFAKAVVLMEEAYVMKDPFSTDFGLIVIGSNCSLCLNPVCGSQSCSVFYTKRFCLACAANKLEEFPSQIQQEVSKNLQQTPS